MAELRWILFGLGILSIGAIWWWSARRSGQAVGDSELRESSAAAPAQALGAAVATGAGIGETARAERRSAPGGTREWGIPPLEPLHIRTAEIEEILPLDQPMHALVDPSEVMLDLDVEVVEPHEAPAAAAVVDAAAPPAAPAATAPSAAPSPPGSSRELFEEKRPETVPAPERRPAPKVRPSPDHSDRHAVEAPQAVNSSETQKIVTLRVCAVGEVRWPGSTLMQALESLGLAYGQYHVFHRKHGDGSSIFCVASLLEPGSFDAATMAEEEFRGVTFFAVLPGPLAPLDVLDALIATARDLARELGGTMQDAKGIPFSPQRAAALREEVARFQALLS